MGIRIRHLTEGDLPFADSVREIAGWNQTLTDWRRFQSLEPEGCFLAESNGEPAGTATTTCYDTDLAWIGMVLVHPDFRRRGIGTALLKHGIRHLRETRGIRCVKLDATPEGLPLYEKLGFVAEWGMKRWMRKGSPKDTKSPREGETLAERHIVLDRKVFGADRRRLLESLQAGGVATLTSEKGFGLARKGSRASYLGPISAEDENSGIEILRELIETVPPGPEELVFIDLPDANEAATELVRRHSFEPVRTLTRMFLGDNATPGDPRRMFGIAEPGLG